MATNSAISGIVNAQSFFRDILGNLPDGTNDTTEAIRRNGNIGINTNPVSTLDVNSNAALTVPILTLDNLTGNYQTFIVDANPNTVVTGSVGDFANDVINGVIYYKASGNATNTGWVALTPTNFSFFGSGVAGVTPPDGTNDLTEGITRQGSVGINVTNANALAAAFDVNGAEVLRALTTTNFAANGSLGTAATTVDLFSTVLIPQTTAGIAVTLPSPTNTTAGRRLVVGNTGTASITVGGTAIPSGQSIEYVWSGTAWLPLAVPTPTNFDFFRSGATASTLPDGVTDTTDGIVHNGNIGIGVTTAFTDATTLAAALDISGAVVERVVNIVAPAGGGALGTAVATVDGSSVVSFSATNNQAYTIPAPTNTTAGRVLKAFLTSATTGATLNGIPIVQNQFTDWVWSGTAWIPQVNSQQFDFWRSGAGATTLPDGTNDVTENIRRNGNVGLNVDATATLDFDGTLTNRFLTITPPGVNGPIGTAATTVDLSSDIQLIIGASGIVYTIPNPSNLTTGRILRVNNPSLFSTTVGGVTLNPGTFTEYVWNGTIWAPLGGGSQGDFFRSGILANTLPDGTTDTTDSIVHNGNIGIGADVAFTDATTTSAALDLSGALVNRHVAITAPAGGGVIATAAASVDRTSTIRLNVTTGQTYTLPAPTNTQSGRKLRVYQNGAATDALLNGTPLFQNQFVEFEWNGAQWLNQGALPNADFWRSGATSSTLPDGTTDVTENIVHNGFVGIGATAAFTNALGVTAALEVSGAVIFRQQALGNFAANGSFGAPDNFSTTTINQTTSGITLSILPPTAATLGRIMKVINVGTATVTVSGQTIAPLTGVEYVWTTGSAWRPLMQPSAASAAPTIQVFQTPAVGTISPFALANVTDIYTSSTVFTNPSSTNSMLCLVTWHFGELRIDFDTGIYNLALRGKAMINGVTQNNPSAYDRRWARKTVGTERWVYTTGTSTYSTTITLAPSASMTLNLNYDYDVNVPPSIPGNGALLIEPSQILTQGWLT